MHTPVVNTERNVCTSLMTNIVCTPVVMFRNLTKGLFSVNLEDTSIEIYH